MGLFGSVDKSFANVLSATRAATRAEMSGMWCFCGNMVLWVILFGVVLLVMILVVFMSKEFCMCVFLVMVKLSFNFGKTYSVLYSDGVIFLFVYLNGVDLYLLMKMYFLFVVLYVFLVVYLCSVFGCESVMMSGFSLCFVIARNTFSVKSFLFFSIEFLKKENWCWWMLINVVGLMSLMDLCMDVVFFMLCV